VLLSEVTLREARALDPGADPSEGAEYKTDIMGRLTKKLPPNLPHCVTSADTISSNG